MRRRFRQGNWGIAIDQATALENIATIKLKFEGSAGTVGEFKIVKLGSNCQCDQTAAECSSKAIRPSTTASSFKASLSGRVLEFAGTTVFDKATIVDLQGNVVKTASAAKAGTRRKSYLPLYCEGVLPVTFLKSFAK